MTNVWSPASSNPSATGVSSYNTRTGAVVPGNADYLAVKSGGLTGAVAATRYVGGTATVAPTTGTFAVGDFVISQNGKVWICTVAGSPGTWTTVSGGGSSPVEATYIGTATSIAQGATDPITWDTLTSGTGLLDITDPTAPIFLAAGTYAITGYMYSTAALTAGGSCQLNLSFSTNNGAAAIDNDTGSTVPEIGVPFSVVAIVAAGDLATPLVLAVHNLDGVATRGFLLGQAVIVKLA